jgi:hypothetical protein
MWNALADIDANHGDLTRELVHVELEAKPVTGLLTDGTGYQYLDL